MMSRCNALCHTSFLNFSQLFTRTWEKIEGSVRAHMCRLFGNRFAKRSGNTVAAACSRWIFLQVMSPSGGSRAGFAAKETDIWADPAVKNRGYDSRCGSCIGKKSTHVSRPLLPGSAGGSPALGRAGCPRSQEPRCLFERYWGFGSRRGGPAGM